MRVIGFATVLAAAVTTATGFAAPTRLSDAQFIAANRCLGLMTSKTLGTPDGEALRKVIKDQSWGREGFIYEKADEAREAAVSDAGRGGADLKARLTAERDGVCQTFLSGAGGASAANRVNGHTL